MSRRSSGLTALMACLAVIAFSTQPTRADVSLPAIFGNNMVLQRDRAVPVWGWAAPGETVTVAFAGQQKTVAAGPDGRWRVALDAMPASAEDRDFTVSGANTVVLTRVLVGEVWLCSGQSNMAWGLAAAAGGKEDGEAAEFPLVRLLRVPTIAAAQPRDDALLAWMPCTPATAPGFSAVGFFFGRKLHRELKVPIGLINSSWGGTMIEPWTPPCGFASVPELKELSERVESWDPRTPRGKEAFTTAVAEIKAWLPAAELAIAQGQYPPEQPLVPAPAVSHQEPTKLYNTMIHPLAPFAMRGAIWYQGESNGNEGETYYQKMQALINGWRHVFENPGLSFYFVQIANYMPDGYTPQGGTGYARIREAQRKSLTLPHTGMAVTIDIGDPLNIHPVNKYDVGIRLARWALARDYGQDIEPSGPLYAGCTVTGNAVRVSFEHTGGGLMIGRKEGMAPTEEILDGELQRFAIAGEDKVWYWADAVIDGRTVVVSSVDVPAPVAVRYAYDASPEGCNLYNLEGLPASPFRTDDW